jgi:hypothetical protein
MDGPSCPAHRLPQARAELGRRDRAGGAIPHGDGGTTPIVFASGQTNAASIVSLYATVQLEKLMYIGGGILGTILLIALIVYVIRRV